MKKNEKEELIAMSTGDIAAFERLFLKYQPQLVYFITGLVHDNDLGRDMTQDIFLSLWENREKMARIESFSSYLFKIAKCSVYNYYDHLNVKAKYTDFYLLQNLNQCTSEEETLFAKELAFQIDEVIDTLSPQRKSIYRLSRLEGLSNDEIAFRLQISKRTVENHLTAALGILRKVIITSVVLYIIFNA